MLLFRLQLELELLTVEKAEPVQDIVQADVAVLERVSFLPAVLVQLPQLVRGNAGAVVDDREVQNPVLVHFGPYEKDTESSFSAEPVGNRIFH